MFFHGTAYSPEDEAWPGWKFYASVDMSPTNSIWRDAPSLMSYITNCQTYLQWGEPDNDFLVYLPVRDMWRKNRDKLLMQFDIHSMKEKAPEFIKAILDIDRAGFDCDYISDRYLLSAEYKDGYIVTAEGTRYKGLIIPGDNLMPEDVKRHLSDMKDKGRISPTASTRRGWQTRPRRKRKDKALAETYTAQQPYRSSLFHGEPHRAGHLRSRKTRHRRDARRMVRPHDGPLQQD